MKKSLRDLTVMLMAVSMVVSLLVFAPAALAVGPDSIPWGEYAAVPSGSAFNSFQGTERAPYICCEPDFSGKLSYDEFAVDFRADYLPIGNYLCVNTWDFDDHGLLSRYSSVRRDYDGVAGYAGFQRNYEGKPLSFWRCGIPIATTTEAI